MENIDTISQLKEIVARLRAPDGCPWDREQTHASLRAGLIEECYEVVDAIDRANDEDMREELGDLLLNIVMHAQMAGERGSFSLEDIAATVGEKMIRRHPHVFGNKSANDSEAVLRQWDAIKRQEKGGSSGILDGLTAGLPALLRAQNTQKKVGRVGFDKMAEETAEIREAIQASDSAATEAEVGDLLFTAVNLARKLGVDAETALNGSTNRFICRFQALERELQSSGREVAGTPLEELDRIWDKVKKG